ncbi:MAG: flagellar basal body L-ring protein FlgH [Pirellulales bacterium]
MTKTTRQIVTVACLMLSVALLRGTASLVRAQDAMLPAPPPQPNPKSAKQSDAQMFHSLHNSSFIFRKLPPEAEARELQIHDIITVLVDYRASMTSEGDAESRKNSNINAVLSQWLAFDGKDIFPAPQRRGAPAVNATLNSQYRTTSDMELRDAMTFRIAAEVVDIRPNGNLVIEARREIRNNEEVWLQSLTGVVRRQSIGPDRTVRSDEVAELRIDKRERGFINDSYSRGWFLRWYDRWKPF